MAGLPIAVNDFDFHADLSAGLVVSSSLTPEDLHTNDFEYDIDYDAIATDIAMHASSGKPVDFRTDGTLALAPEGESAIAYDYHGNPVTPIETLSVEKKGDDWDYDAGFVEVTQPYWFYDERTNTIVYFDETDYYPWSSPDDELLAKEPEASPSTDGSEETGPPRQLDSVSKESMSKDPIGFGGGDANLYRMTGNHPNMATDPSGLDETTPDWLHRQDYTDVRNVKASEDLNNALYWANRYVDASIRIQQYKATNVGHQNLLNKYGPGSANFDGKERFWHKESRDLVHENNLRIGLLESDLHNYSAKLANDFGSLQVPRIVVDYADDLTDYYFDGGSGGMGALQLATFLRSNGRELGENYSVGGGLQGSASPLDFLAVGGAVFVQNMLKGAAIRLAASQAVSATTQEVAVEVVGPLALLRPRLAPKGPISPKSGLPIPTPSTSPIPQTTIANTQSAIGHINAGTNPPWGGKWGFPHGNREGNLPKFDPAGNPITYSEYYLPKSPGDTTKWGSNRLVVGTDNNVYCTTTHYGQSGNPPFVHIGTTK